MAVSNWKHVHKDVDRYGKIHDYTPLGRAVAQELQKRG